MSKTKKKYKAQTLETLQRKAKKRGIALVNKQGQKGTKKALIRKLRGKKKK